MKWIKTILLAVVLSFPCKSHGQYKMVRYDTTSVIVNYQCHDTCEVRLLPALMVQGIFVWQGKGKADTQKMLVEYLTPKKRKIVRYHSIWLYSK
jgi:hypothetical protein